MLPQQRRGMAGGECNNTVESEPVNETTPTATPADRRARRLADKHHIRDPEIESTTS